MKKIFKLLMVIPLLAMTACVGQKPDDGPAVTDFIKLTTASKQVDYDKSEKVIFTVTANGEDVTAKSQIINTTDGGYVALKDKSGNNVYEYTPPKLGSHTFFAIYGEGSSESASVRSVSSNTENKAFYRRNAVMKFTGTWCYACPQMSKAIKDVLVARPDRLVEVAIHNNDPLAIPMGGKIQNYFKVTGLPSVIVDYRTDIVGSATSGSITKVMDASLRDNPTASGIKMAVNNEGGVLQIETETMVTRDGEYNVFVAILVDGYNYEQTGTTDPNYRQNSVSREFLSESMFGAELGKMVAADKERKSKSFSYTLPAGADVTRYRVVAMVLNKVATDSYLINNIIECNVGQSTDYEYEQE